MPVDESADLLAGVGGSGSGDGDEVEIELEIEVRGGGRCGRGGDGGA